MPLSFFDLPADLTLWTLLNSQFLATVVGAIVAILVAVYGKKAADAAADAAAEQGASNAAQQASQLELAEADGVEAIGAEEIAEVPGAHDFRPHARDLIAGAKKFLDDKAFKDPDGRHRRTYEAISRYDYVPLAVALSVRGQLSQDQLAAAVALFGRWKNFERGRAANKIVSQEVLQGLRELFDDLQANR